MTTYFKFDIPTNEDGSRISYSPGWCGTMDKVPSDAVVDLYNDEEGFGIAHTPDKSLPKEVQLLSDKEVASILENTKEVDGVYLGVNVFNRAEWSSKVSEPVEVLETVETEAIDGR